MAKKSDDSTHVSRGAIHDKFYKNPHPPKPLAQLRKDRGKVAPDGREPLGTTERATDRVERDAGWTKLVSQATVSREGKGLHHNSSKVEFDGFKVDKGMIKAAPNKETPSATKGYYASKTIASNQAEAQALGKKMLKDKAKKKD